MIETNIWAAEVLKHQLPEAQGAMVIRPTELVHLEVCLRTEEEDHNVEEAS